MKVHLSNGPSSDTSFKNCSNLASFDNMCSDSEVTSLNIDCFLSSFSFSELGDVVGEILKKCRIGCNITISEPDCDILFRMYTRDDLGLKN